MRAAVFGVPAMAWRNVWQWSRKKTAGLLPSRDSGGGGTYPPGVSDYRECIYWLVINLPYIAPAEILNLLYRP